MITNMLKSRESFSMKIVFAEQVSKKKRSSVIRVIKSESLQLSSFSPNKEKVQIDFTAVASVVVVVK